MRLGRTRGRGDGRGRRCRGGGGRAAAGCAGDRIPGGMRGHCSGARGRRSQVRAGGALFVFCLLHPMRRHRGWSFSAVFSVCSTRNGRVLDTAVSASSTAAVNTGCLPLLLVVRPTVRWTGHSSSTYAPLIFLCPPPAPIPPCCRSAPSPRKRRKTTHNFQADGPTNPDIRSRAPPMQGRLQGPSWRAWTWRSAWKTRARGEGRGCRSPRARGHGRCSPPPHAG